MESEPRPARRARIEKKEKPKSHWLPEALRHPLTVLFIGTVITSMAVPWLNARSARARQIEDARQQKALEILKGTTDDNARLNAVRSAFQVFEREGGLTGQAETIEARRAELRKRVYDGYGEFEQSAWWWYWNIGREAELFGWLPPGDIAEFRRLAQLYQDNLFECSNLVQAPWKKYLSDTKETATERKSALMPTIETPLGKKQAERDELCARMVRLFLK
jgi:hypothetical protein